MEKAGMWQKQMEMTKVHPSIDLVSSLPCRPCDCFSLLAHIGFLFLGPHTGCQRIKWVSICKAFGTVLVHGKSPTTISYCYFYFIVSFIIVVFYMFLLWGGAPFANYGWWMLGRQSHSSSMEFHVFLLFSKFCFLFLMHSLRSQIFYYNAHSAFYYINCTV